MKKLIAKFLEFLRRLFGKKAEAPKKQCFIVPIKPPEPQKQAEKVERMRGVGFGTFTRIRPIMRRSVRPMLRAEKRMIERELRIKIP